MMTSALIIVDVQNDFSPSGALPVGEGHEIVPIINQLMGHFDYVIATQDWHPAGHASFASTQQRKVGEVINLGGEEQYLWPDHCLQGTYGAEFINGLYLDGIDKIIRKGVDQAVDSYSGFFDNRRQNQTELADYLKEKKVNKVYVTGLATDFCVKFTALDSCELGFTTSVIMDACRGVNPDDIDTVSILLQQAGCQIDHSDHFLNKPR